MSPDQRAQLKDLLRQRAFRHQPDAPFTLASGVSSPFYFNCKEVTLSGAGFNLLGPVLFSELDAFEDVAAAGGLTLGADPLALALASHASQNGRPLDALIIRKQAKGHGTRQWLEGPAQPSAGVLILDDVVTTGGSTIQAIERAAASGFLVRGVLVLVDRQECDGVASIQAALQRVQAPPLVRAVFRAEEFLTD